MPLRFDLNSRLEPRRPGGDLDDGFRARVADPLWFLGRQWQMGEHQGEDAASPVGVAVAVSEAPLDPVDGDPALDPRTTPAEAIIEAEPGGWWTVGRRVRLGLAAAASVPAGLAPEADAALRLLELVAPYDGLNGGYDGRALYGARAALGLPVAIFAEVPTREPADRWDPAELVYGARFTTGGGGGATLDVPRHDGGDVDWYSVRAAGPQPAIAPLAPAHLTPGRLRYPGAPHPRWWQIEDARVDIGGFPPDRSHFATMLLIDLVTTHADDWFTIPIATHAGSVVTVTSFEVQDAFDDVTTLSPPAAWSLFRVAGLGASSLLVWPTVATPLTGQALDEVVLGVDEDANLLMAVELRARGRELAAEPPVDPPAPPATGQLRAGERSVYGYRPSTSMPPFWHPYVISEVDGRRRYVQARLQDLDARPPELMPAPTSSLLLDPGAPAAGPVHQLEPSTIPVTGLRLDRRFVLGRRTDGQPVLWLQRRRLPLVGPPVSNLRFDVLEQQLEPT
jgi:hypothetical protein